MSEKTIRIELPDSQWVELYNLGRQSVRRIKQIAEAWDAARGTEGPTGVVGTAEQERLLRERVAAWHLIDPDSGLVLVVPATDDLGGLELETLGTLVRSIESMLRGAGPKGPSASSSGPS